MANKNKPKGRHKLVEIPIYKKLLMIIDSEDLEYGYQFGLEEFYETGDVAFAHTIYSGYGKDNRKCIYVVLNSKHTEFRPSIIAHESVHVVNMVFHMIGHEPDVNNDEPQAYLTEWVFDKTIRFILD